MTMIMKMETIYQSTASLVQLYAIPSVDKLSTSFGLPVLQAKVGWCRSHRFIFPLTIVPFFCWPCSLLLVDVGVGGSIFVVVVGGGGIFVVFDVASLLLLLVVVAVVVLLLLLLLVLLLPWCLLSSLLVVTKHIILLIMFFECFCVIFTDVVSSAVMLLSTHQMHTRDAQRNTWSHFTKKICYFIILRIFAIIGINCINFQNFKEGRSLSSAIILTIVIVIIAIYCNNSNCDYDCYCHYYYYYFSNNTDLIEIVRKKKQRVWRESEKDYNEKQK